MATWYRTGTAAFTNGSTTVTGTGTAWAANARTGDALHAPDGRAYEIASVSSDTEITLATDFLGSTASGQDYAIQPTRGITVEFNNNALSLLATVQDYVDTALAGRFGNGSVGSPSLSFSGDTDTGFYRPDANEIGAATGGVRRTLLSSSAYQIDVPITASDRLDFDSPVTIGTNSGGTTSDLSFSANAVIGTESSLSVGWESGGSMRWLDGITDSEGGNAGGTEVMRIDGEALTLNDVPSWAEVVTIADDAVAEITLPSALLGYFISLVPYRPAGGIDAVQQRLAFIGQVDTGETTTINQVFAGDDIETSTSTLTGTTGTDGKMTIAPTDSGTILIENRMGASRTCPVRIW